MASSCAFCSARGGRFETAIRLAGAVLATSTLSILTVGCPPYIDEDDSGRLVKTAPEISIQYEARQLPGASLVLDASTTSDADGDNLTFAWQQTGGPTVVLINASTSAASFIAPQVLSEITLVFKLQVSDGTNTVEQSISIEIAPSPFTGARTLWAADTEDLNADLAWQLPTGAYLDVKRADWGPTGIESIAVNPSVIPNGRHDVSYYLNGAGHSGAIAFAVDLFDYHYVTAVHLAGITYRTLAIDVLDGQALPLFNGWLSDTEPGSGGITGRYDVELLGAWRDGASDEFHTDVNLRLPNDAFADVERADWALQGLEHVAFARGTPVADGDYTIYADTNGQGRTANVAMDFKILNFLFSTRQSMLGGERRIIGLDVRNGVANVLFNGWLASGEQGSGGLTAERPLQTVGAWRNGSGSNDGVNLDVNARLPDGTYLDVRRSDWGKQGYEHAFLDGVAPPDGTYQFNFELNGNGRTGEVTYRAKLLNWQFERTGTMLGGTEHQIQVQVSNGVATLVASDW